MSELGRAKAVRDWMCTKANGDLNSLGDMLGGLEEKDTVTESETATLTSTMDRAQISLEKYEESIERVMVLEGFEDWDEEDEHAIESMEIWDIGE